MYIDMVSGWILKKHEWKIKYNIGPFSSIEQHCNQILPELKMMIKIQYFLLCMDSCKVKTVTRLSNLHYFMQQNKILYKNPLKKSQKTKYYNTRGNFSHKTQFYVKIKSLTFAELD